MPTVAELDQLAADYTAEAIPVCPVCGQPRARVQVAGSAAVWVCPAWEPDSEAPAGVRLKAGRSIWTGEPTEAEHLKASRFVQDRRGDPRVVGLVAFIKSRGGV